MMNYIAVITGGTKGIGLSLTKKMLSQGFKVYVSARNPCDDIEIAQHPNCFFFKSDFSDNKQVNLFAEFVKSRENKIHVLINNAGVFIPGKIQEENPGQFELLMQINVNSAYHLTRQLLPLLHVSNDGYIFNICSTASIIAYENGGSYCISKHALLGFSRVLRKELMKNKVAVSSVLPGATITDSWDGTDLPEERFILPENIAEIVWTAWLQRKNAVIEEILIRPVLGDL
jgi:short-subunit dehydrogenase